MENEKIEEEKVLLTYDEAVAMLPPGEYIHTFLNPEEGTLVGMELSRGEILLLLEKVNTRELAGPLAHNLHHDLVVWLGSTPIFISTEEQ